MHDTASRKPGMALVSLPSVALSSITVKQFQYIIEGVSGHPLKIKVVLDKGYTSDRTT